MMRCKRARDNSVLLPHFVQENPKTSAACLLRLIVGVPRLRTRRLDPDQTNFAVSAFGFVHGIPSVPAESDSNGLPSHGTF